MNRVTIVLISLLGVIVLIALLPEINSVMVAYLLFIAKITAPISYYTGMDGFLLLIAAAGLLPFFIGLVLYALFEEIMIKRRGNGLMFILIIALLAGFFSMEAEAITPEGIQIQREYDRVGIISERSRLRVAREKVCKLQDKDLRNWLDRRVALYALEVDVHLRVTGNLGKRKAGDQLPPEWRIEPCKK